MTEHVLVAMDGSPEAEAALEYALELGDVAITIVTVVDPFDVDPLTPGMQSPLGRAGMPAYSQEWYEAEWRNVGVVPGARARARRGGRRRGHDRPAARPTGGGDSRLRGRPGRRSDRRGATSENEFSRVLMSSTAEAVTRRSPVTVTVVRPD